MRFVFAALVATVAMGAAVSTAQASTGASVTNGVTLASANGTLTLGTELINIACRVTLGLRLNRSIAKRLLAEIGQILPSGAGSNVTNCDLDLAVTVLNGITVGYVGYTGELPDIETIEGRSNNAAFELSGIIGRCLYTGQVPATFNRNILTGEIETVELRGTGLAAASGCPQPGTLRGTLVVLEELPVIELI